MSSAPAGSPAVFYRSSNQSQIHLISPIKKPPLTRAAQSGVLNQDFMKN